MPTRTSGVESPPRRNSPGEYSTPQRQDGLAGKDKGTPSRRVDVWFAAAKIHPTPAPGRLNGSHSTGTCEAPRKPVHRDRKNCRAISMEPWAPSEVDGLGPCAHTPGAARSRTP